MNNEYCILLSKLLLPLLHKTADFIYMAEYSIPWKLNSNHFFLHVTENSTNMQLIFEKCIYVRLFAFHVLPDMQHKQGPSTGPWNWLFTLSSVMFMVLSSMANKQCCARYFHPTLPSDVSTLKSNRVVKQSLKQSWCNHWLFYCAPWFRCRGIMARPSAHLRVF